MKTFLGGGLENILWPQIIASVSPPRDPSVNWLRMEASTSKLVVRQTFLDRSQETAASLSIVCLGAAESAGGSSHVPLISREDEAKTLGMRPPLTPADVASGLSGSAMFVNGAAMQFLSWSNMFAAKARNSFIVLDKETYMTAWADPNIFFLHGYWSLGVEEALIIEVRHLGRRHPSFIPIDRTSLSMSSTSR